MEDCELLGQAVIDGWQHGGVAVRIRFGFWRKPGRSGTNVD